MSLVRGLDEQGQVFPAEAGRIRPFALLVLVKFREADAVPGTRFGLVGQIVARTRPTLTSWAGVFFVIDSSFGIE